MISEAGNDLAFAEAKLELDGPTEPIPRMAQGEEAQLLAYLNERVQQALLAAGVRVQSVCVESDEGQPGICAAVALADDQMKQDAAVVLDGFRLRYQLM
jgi:hypothetical protein